MMKVPSIDCDVQEIAQWKRKMRVGEEVESRSEDLPVIQGAIEGELDEFERGQM